MSQSHLEEQDRSRSTLGRSMQGLGFHCGGAQLGVARKAGWHAGHGLRPLPTGRVSFHGSAPSEALPADESGFIYWVI